MAKRDKIVGDLPPEPPRCVGCGKPLAPQFGSVSETRASTQLSEIPAPYTCHPDDAFLISKGYDPAEIDPETGQFVLRSHETVPVGRKWLGYYGYDYNSLFCTKECGYRWAVRELKSRRQAT